MRVRLRLADGQTNYTRLNIRDDRRPPLVILQAILEDNPTGWLGCFSNESLTSGQRLVNIAQIVTADLV